ncbi:MAG: UDP-N-acetylmuramate dehydrogenase [Candidatus Omnitrophota bacterium]
MNWPKDLRDKVKEGEALKDKTTFRIGGCARFFAEPENGRELKDLLICARKNNLPVFILGSGSNILVNDKGVRGLVLRLNSPFFRKIKCQRNFIESASGVKIKELILKSYNNGLSGFEFLAGIPGTTAGALAMNAGSWGRSIGELAEEVKVMDYSGREKLIKKKGIRFGYRNSSLSKYIILGARFKLNKEKKAKIKENISGFLARRFQMQDLSFPNAGCIFRNPPQEHAGRLIDLCGLKGKKAGGAVISSKHGNFILNKGQASCSDVLSLMNLAKKKVKKKFNISLAPEIKIWR